MIRSRSDGSHYCDGHYCGYPLAWFPGDPEDGASGELVCLDCNSSMYADAPDSPAVSDTAAVKEGGDE